MNNYQAGYINLATGSDIVEGLGTLWLSFVHAGDTLYAGGTGWSATVDEVQDNHLIKLSTTYAGAPIQGGTYQITLEPVVETLDQIKVAAAWRVDQLAGQKRLKYTTSAPGQEMTYVSKLADAKAYIAAGYPSDASPYPWIHAEATACSATPAQVADLIVYTAAQWTAVGAQIEGARQAAKRTGTLATTAAAVYAAEAAFIAAVTGL